MLLDGYGLVYRGYFALPPLTTSRGDLVNGVFGFASIVLRGLQDLQPDYLAVSFDLPGPTFRHEQYADYKATRTKMPDDLRDQFPKVREVVKALRIPVYEMPGYEADDVIGTITQQLDSREDLETTIVTVDLDMLQLVTPRVRLMTTRSGVENTVMYDVAKIDERFGLRPDQMIDYKALKGDPTDNIPGVPGRGREDRGEADPRVRRPRRAARPARRGHAREARATSSLEHVDQIRDGPASSRRSSATCRSQIDLEAARLGDYDRDTVVRLFREYEFRTLIERLPPMAGESAEQRTESLRSVVESGYVPRRASPAGRTAGARPDHARGPRAASSSSGSTSMRSRGRRAAVGTERTQPSGADAGRRAASRPRTCRSALAAAIVDPGRIEVRGADRIEELADWLAAQPAVGVVARRRRSAAAPRHPARARRRGRGRPRRRGRGRGGRRRPAPPRRAARDAARRPRGQAGARRPLRGRPGGSRPRRSRSTRRSRPTS